MNERPGRQDRWQELTRSECFELLARERLGRVAVIDDLGPVVFPVNFVLDRHMVVLRTDEGTKTGRRAQGQPGRVRDRRHRHRGPYRVERHGSR
jgi:nitroimidazol reductase NimA-like FMN-containing flavoprotein (pyridoxamine 5'-phosphate oxidase superfamily)